MASHILFIPPPVTAISRAMLSIRPLRPFHLLALLLLPGWCVAAPPLRIAFDSGNPPAMWGEGAAVRGLQPTLIAAAAKEAGVAVTLHGMPWPRALEGLAQGHHCVGGAFKSAERSARYQFSESVHEQTIVAVVLAASPLTELHQAEELRALHVGLHRGWSYSEKLDALVAEPALRSTRFTSGNRLFLALESGKVDVVLTDGDSVAMEARILRKPVRVLAVLSRNGTHVMCPPGPDYSEALARLNSVIRKLRGGALWEALTQQELER